MTSRAEGTRRPEQPDLIDQVTAAPEFSNKPGIPDLRHELLLAERLRGFDAIVEVFGGDTDAPERRERFRRAIIDRQLELAICGRSKERKPLTFAQAYERLYGEPLAHHLPPKRRKDSAT